MKTSKAHAATKKRPDFGRYCRLVDLYVACLKHARAHHDAATALLDAGFVSQAYAIAFTGWEEIGKAQIVADFANGMAAESEYDEAFRSHGLKVAYNSRRFELNVADIPASIIKYELASAKHLFEARQRALYVGKDDKDGPILPDTEIPRDAVEKAIKQLTRELDNIDMQDAISERIGSASFLK